MPANIGYAATDAHTPLVPFEFDRPAVGPDDVRIDIRFCGVCHSDIHQAGNEWSDSQPTTYPNMPGREIVGVVSEVGANVTRFSIGDVVGVGCMVFWGDTADRSQLDEQYQATPPVLTYISEDPRTGGTTFGGYSDQIVVHEHFVLRIPQGMPLEQAAPLLCAGITTLSPLAHWDVGAGMRVGVAGIGGLGHVAVQLGVARGAEVVALTTTPEKAELARRLGATDVIVMTDTDAVAAAERSLDFILSTIPTSFDMKPYLPLLNHDGTFVTVGMLETVDSGDIDFAAVSMERIRIAGSFIGGVAETQELLDFAAEHNVLPTVEVIAAAQINDAFERIVSKDVRFRYVIDNSTLRR